MRNLKTAHQAAEQLLAAAREGNSMALDRLLAASCPRLLAEAKQNLGAVLRIRLDAADVVQQTLLEASLAFPRFQGRTAKDLFAWLRRILHNNLVNERRRHIRTTMRSIHCEVPLTEAALHHLPDRGGGESNSPDMLAQARERSEALDRALRQLPEHYRQALLLRTWEELTFVEIGHRLRCSAEAARKLWGRAAAKLVATLRDSREHDRH